MAVSLKVAIVLLWTAISVQAACPAYDYETWNEGYQYGSQVRNPGWSAVDGRCLSTVRTYPSKCDELCITNGGRWATVESQAQNDWFVDRGKEVDNNIWIGLTDTAAEGTYQWTNPGDSVTYTNWGPGEPTNDATKQCAFMWRYSEPLGSFGWHASICTAGRIYCGCTMDDPEVPHIPETPEAPTQPTVPAVVCPDGWESRFGKCYLTTLPKQNYADCLSHCNSLEATLPCVHNAEESLYLVNLYPNDLEACAFLGLNDIVTEGTFQWQEGCSSSFTYFYPGEPNNAGSAEDCVSACWKGNTMWNDLLCSYETFCVCEKEGHTATPTFAPTPSVTRSDAPTNEPPCPDGWVNTLGKCYLTTVPKKNYADCLSHCTALGATLPCVMNAEENIYVAGIFPTGPGEEHFDLYLGYTDIVTEGKFVWQEGCSSTFTNFFPNEPNDYGGGEDCATVYTEGSTKWNDAPCSMVLRCACEMPQGPAHARATESFYETVNGRTMFLFLVIVVPLITVLGVAIACWSKRKTNAPEMGIEMTVRPSTAAYTPLEGDCATEDFSVAASVVEESRVSFV